MTKPLCKDSAMKSALQDFKHDILKWMMVMFLAQTVILIAAIIVIK